MPTVRTMCPMNCHPTLCGMLAETDNGRLVAVRGDPDNPDSRGFLCVRGRDGRSAAAHTRLCLMPSASKLRSGAGP
jgi:anaerobic selenocysteine-containing dehydrogenase